MANLTLAERLLSKMSEIARRSDVVVHSRTATGMQINPKWQAVLPADMFAFYQARNGLSSDKKARDVMTATRAPATALHVKELTRERFARHFAVGQGAVVEATLVLKYLDGPLPLEEHERTLVRALLDVEGLNVTSDYPGNPDVLRTTHYPHAITERWIGYTPFIACAWNRKFHGDKNKIATFRVVLSAAQAAGLEEGKVYSSTALPSVI